MRDLFQSLTREKCGDLLQPNLRDGKRWDLSRGNQHPRIHRARYLDTRQFPLGGQGRKLPVNADCRDVGCGIPDGVDSRVNAGHDDAGADVAQFPADDGGHDNGPSDGDDDGATHRRLVWGV